MEMSHRLVFTAIAFLVGGLLSTVLAMTTRAEAIACLPSRLLVRSQQYAESVQSSGNLSLEDFTRILKDLQNNFQSSIFLSGTEKADCREIHLGNFTNTQIRSSDGNCSHNQEKCPSIFTIYLRHSDSRGLNYTQLPAAVLETLLTAIDSNCFHDSTDGGEKHKSTTAQVWGYGIGFVSLVAVISNIGGFLTPVMSKTFFQRLLQFLVAMAAGTLVGTGLFVLIPEAFNLMSCARIGESYLWKSATALLSIYIFFMSERVLKCFLKDREFKYLRQLQKSDAVMELAEDAKPLKALVNGDHGHSHFRTASNGKSADPDGGEEHSQVKTLAWMVLTGDVIHNFVDGMAIGAGFTENVYMGVTISIAVLCEELPHELGDIAILIASGMTMKRALFLNFLSACVCFLGLGTGIVLGGATVANRWILAVAGGLFLYVPLVDMLPDMTQHLEQEMKEAVDKTGRLLTPEVKLLVFVQGLGLLLGMCLILVVIYFSTKIQI